MFVPLKKSYCQPRQSFKKQWRYFANKGLCSQSYDFSSSHVWMWELDYRESWALETWCCCTMGLEKTFESSLDCKEIKPISPKGNQSCIFIGRIDVEAETPILWPPYVKNWLIGKDPVSGKDWRQEEKWMTEDEMVGWHHRPNGHEFEQTLGVGDWQGSLACCSPWGHRESDMTEQLNWSDQKNKWKGHRTCHSAVHFFSVSYCWCLMCMFLSSISLAKILFCSPVFNLCKPKKKWATSWNISIYYSLKSWYQNFLQCQ